MSRKGIPPSAAKALRRLGQDIQLARRRRRIRQRDLAARMGVSVTTLRALEAGAPGVSMGTLAAALLAMGLLPQLDALVDAGKDEIGLFSEVEALPKRIRIQQVAGGRPGDGALATKSGPGGALL